MRELPSWQWGYPVDGRAIIADVKRSLAIFQSEFVARQTKVAILRFQAPPDLSDLDRSRFDAARISMEQKTKTFESLGCHIERIEALPYSLSPSEFRGLIERLNRDPKIRGIIVQYPVPRLLESFVREIAPEKDLDALAAVSPFAVPATSEGIVRLIEPFASEALIAVVGARGFVGRGVVQQLRERGFDVLALDQCDQGFVETDLLKVRDVDIVVSATGQPELLDERHLTPYHRLVVDAGFVTLDGRLHGDIREVAKTISQNYTPVPGGIGPTEMAILIERMVRKEVASEINAWQLKTTNPVIYYTRFQVQQQQIEWAKEIFQIAISKFIQRLNTRPEMFRFEGDALVLEGNQYQLSLDQSQNSFSVADRGARGVLANYNFTQGSVISAAGLTFTDMANWRQFALERGQDEEQER